NIFAGSGDNLLVNARGKLFINCATTSPQVHVEIEKLAHQAGAQTLEACMASSIPQAREGRLYLMCGGTENAFRRAEPILKELGSDLRFIGKAGEAAKVKALVNMVMNINTAGLAEGLALGAAAGLDLEMLRQVFSQTGAASRVLETDGEDMQNREHSCFFSAAHAAKDSGIALELGRSLGLDLLLARATKEQYDRMVAEGLGELDRMPTGDGMALLLFHNLEQPARRALEISKALRNHPRIQLRMGIHSGPVNPVTDVNDRTNFAGSGINVAQRVLDCGDAGHILLSAHVAEDLGQYRHWRPYLHDLGECEVKHGLRLRLFNLYKDDLGNSQVPEKLKQKRRKEPSGVRPISTPRWPKLGLTAAILLLAGALAASFYIFVHRAPPPTGASAPGTTATSVLAAIPEKSIAVLPFENLSSDKENAYFADGIQDEILTRLSKIADLKVISRTSTQHYKSAPGNLSEIAKELGVAH